MYRYVYYNITFICAVIDKCLVYINDQNLWHNERSEVDCKLIGIKRKKVENENIERYLKV